MFLVLFLLTVLWLWVGQAKGNCWIEVPLKSYHSERDKNYNENNQGLGGECEMNKNFRLKGGFYENSFHRETVHFGVLTTTQNSVKLFQGDLRPALYLTRASGYTKKNIWGPIPMLMFEHQSGHGLNFATLYYEKEWVFGIEYKYRF